MLGEVVEVGGGVVLEPVAPGHVEDDIGAAHRLVDARVPGEDVDRDPLRPPVDAVHPQIEGLDLQAALEKLGDDVTTDVTTGSGDENRLTHGSRF